MEELKSSYLTFLKQKKKVSMNTVHSYDQDLGRFFSYLSKLEINNIQQISDTTIQSYLLFLEKNHFSAATIARNLISLRSFFDYMVYIDQIKVSPVGAIKAPRIERKSPQKITVEEVDKLLSLPDVNSTLGVRDKAILELMYATGLKPTELITLEVSDVNLNHDILTCRGETRQRLIPFGHAAHQILHLYMEVHRPELQRVADSEVLFLNRNGQPMTRQGLWKIIKGYAAKMNLNQLTPQILRNSFAMHLIENGAQISSVGEMMGYMDPFMAYSYTDHKDARIRDEYIKAHPRA